MRSRDFLDRYYGNNVNFRGMMGLRSASAVIDLRIRLVVEDQVEQFIRDVLPAVNLKHGEK